MSRLGLFVFLAVVSVAIAQSPPKPTIVVSRLSPPTYPKLALQARIATTVVLDVAIRPDGSVESVALFSGHPMLNDAAMESARKTTFECKDCGEPSTSYRMTYQFELGDAVYCKDASAETQVSQSQDTIVVLGHPSGTCDPSVRISYLKFRSAKCLYLWHCGKQQLD